MKKGIGFIALLIGLHSSVKCQDFILSQFMSQPSLVNPGLVGSDKYDFEAYSLYRDQWAAITKSIRTITFGGEAKVLKDSEGNNLAAGIQFFTDQHGLLKLRHTQAMATVAYQLVSGRSSRMGFGVSAIYGSRSIRLDESLKWDNQYNGFYYDPALESGENIANQKTQYFDLSVGYTFRQVKKWGLSRTFGVSLFHPHQPKQAFLFNEKDRLLRRYQVFYEEEFRYQHFMISPQITASKQGAAYHILVGSWVAYTQGVDSRHTTASNSSLLKVGVFHRWMDALIFAVRYEFKRKYGIGASYDLNLSKLRQVSRFHGGFELTLFYQGFFTENRMKL